MIKDFLDEDGKFVFDAEKVKKYVNSANQELETNKTVQKNDNKYNLKGSSKVLEDLKGEMREKNSYFSRSKKPEVNAADLKRQEEEIRKKMSTHTEFDRWAEDTFDKKAPYERNFDPMSKNRENLKDKYSYPITSSSTIGWLPPIDDLDTTNNINSATRQFLDQGHLG